MEMQQTDHNGVAGDQSEQCGQPLTSLAIVGGIASAGLLVAAATGAGGPALHHALSLATVVAVVVTAVFAAAAILRRLVCQVHRREMAAAEGQHRADLVAADERHRAEMHELIVWHSDRLGEAEERYADRLAELQEAGQRDREQHRADLAAAEERHAVDLRHHLQIAERAWATQLEAAKGRSVEATDVIASVRSINHRLTGQ